MATQAAVRMAEQSYAAQSGKRHLLIVTDCSDRLTGLRALLHADGVEITGATSLEDLSRACHNEHDLVVIDVGAAHLPEVLRALRSSERYCQISLWRSSVMPPAIRRHMIQNSIQTGFSLCAATPCENSVAVCSHRHSSSG